jgi:serine/threonine protein kinase
MRTRLATSKAYDVWLAEIDSAPAAIRPVVLKKLRAEFATDGKRIESLVERARIAQSLQHENILTVLDVIHGPRDCGFVCEYLDGKTLRQLIAAVSNAGNALPVWFGIHVAQCICLALQHAHEHPTEAHELGYAYHQNLCPENVFLTYRGNVKVADFGLSHTVVLNEANQTAASSRSTTLSEQYTDEAFRKRQEQVDLDAVGRLLYELLTGVCPDAPDGSPIDFIPPSHHAPWINAEVDQLLRRVLSPSYPQRITTAAELWQALEEYLTQRRHDVSATHIAGLVTLLFSNETHDNGPSTVRFDDTAEHLAHLRSRRTSPPDGDFRTSFEHVAPTRPGLSIPASEQNTRPTLRSPAITAVSSDTTDIASTPISSSDVDSQTANSDNKSTPFHHDWDLALKRAREQTQQVPRTSGTYVTQKAIAPSPPIDPVEQAVIEFEKGLELRLRGELEGALAAWEKALELDPQHRVCRANLNLLKKKLNIA